MSKLLRHFAPGQCCFITSVTSSRRPLLVQPAGLLKCAVRRAESKSPFTIVAWVILPDHFHAVLDTPEGNTSAIVQRVKLSFSLQYRSLCGGKGPVWQHRYWDHVILSEQDLRHHIDYIHYNPVKHAIADSPENWSLSSFRDFLEAGYYDLERGWRSIATVVNAFGE